MRPRPREGRRTAFCDSNEVPQDERGVASEGKWRIRRPCAPASVASDLPGAKHGTTPRRFTGAWGPPYELISPARTRAAQGPLRPFGSLRDRASPVTSVNSGSLRIMAPLCKLALAAGPRSAFGVT